MKYPDIYHRKMKEYSPMTKPLSILGEQRQMLTVIPHGYIFDVNSNIDLLMSCFSSYFFKVETSLLFSTFLGTPWEHPKAKIYLLIYEIYV